MYRQLDQRISGREVCIFLFPLFIYAFFVILRYLLDILFQQRSSFGFAHRIHLYSDHSILVCDYLSQGTLQVHFFYFVYGNSTCIGSRQIFFSTLDNT